MQNESVTRNGRIDHDRSWEPSSAAGEKETERYGDQPGDATPHGGDDKREVVANESEQKHGLSGEPVEAVT